MDLKSKTWWVTRPTDGSCAAGRGKECRGLFLPLPGWSQTNSNHWLRKRRKRNYTMINLVDTYSFHSFPPIMPRRQCSELAWFFCINIQFEIPHNSQSINYKLHLEEEGPTSADAWRYCSVKTTTCCSIYCSQIIDTLLKRKVNTLWIEHVHDYWP